MIPFILKCLNFRNKGQVRGCQGLGKSVGKSMRGREVGVVMKEQHEA